jgi:Arc/MetJ family transcription regulator
MSRTNIDIDDELIAEVMRRLGVKTKREAVDLALRKVAGPRLTKEDLDAVRGVGFEVDLAELRDDRVSEW